MNAEVLPFEGIAGPPWERPIDLAREPEFQLGNIVVKPGLREIFQAEGTRQTLEPRVMQVLVALARADGEIVSRDDLVRTCWNGTIVGDDAINRPISLLRRLSEGTGKGSFRIETIPRVGYRLIEGSHRHTTSDPEPPRRLSRVPLWAGLAVAAAVAGGLTAWPARPQGPTYSIALQHFRAPPAAANFDDQLSSALTSLDVPTIGGRRALTLTGSVMQDGGGFTVNARLFAPGRRGTVWSGAITRPSVGARELAETAKALGLIAQCALAGANDAKDLAPELLSLYARTCELGARGQNALGRRVARELTARAPDFPGGWFALSHHALTLYLSEPRPDPVLREEALAAARKLVALRPNAQDGYRSEALALGPRQWRERERLLRRAAALDPIYVDGAQAFLSDLLLEVGRADEAFQLDQGLARQNPDDPVGQLRLALSAEAAGSELLADRAIARARALDPDRAQTLLWRSAVWRRDWPDAERYLPPRDPVLDEVQRSAYRALATGDEARKDAAAKAVMKLPDGCCAPMRAELLTLLGRHAEAIALLEKLDAGGSSGAPPFDVAWFLTDPAMRPLWRDPAIEPLLGRIGLVDYWRASGTRPDLCAKADAPEFCRLLKG